jgi:hypothetical protein
VESRRASSLVEKVETRQLVKYLRSNVIWCRSLDNYAR